MKNEYLATSWIISYIDLDKFFYRSKTFWIETVSQNSGTTFIVTRTRGGGLKGARRALSRARARVNGFTVTSVNSLVSTLTSSLYSIKDYSNLDEVFWISNETFCREPFESEDCICSSIAVTYKYKRLVGFGQERHNSVYIFTITLSNVFNTNSPVTHYFDTYYYF